VRTLPAICNWDYQKIKKRETFELSSGGFGNWQVKSSKFLKKFSEKKKKLEAQLHRSEEVI